MMKCVLCKYANDEMVIFHFDGPADMVEYHVAIERLPCRLQRRLRNVRRYSAYIFIAWMPCLFLSCILCFHLCGRGDDSITVSLCQVLPP